MVTGRYERERRPVEPSSAFGRPRQNRAVDVIHRTVLTRPVILSAKSPANATNTAIVESWGLPLFVLRQCLSRNTASFWKMKARSARPLRLPHCREIDNQFIRAPRLAAGRPKGVPHD